jgi:hypothetical protein
MKDPKLEAYVEAIEALFARRRGAERVLGPRDFALARSWYESGVPLANLLTAIEEVFAAGGSVSSLSFCAARVEARAKGLASARREPIPTRWRDAADALGELCDGLARLASDARTETQALLGRVHATRQRLEDDAPEPQLEATLKAIDQEVDQLLLRTLPRESLESCRAESARALRRAQGRVDPEALEDALRRFAVDTARARLGLPRVGP